MTAPCFGCEKRSEICHTVCGEYKEFQAECIKRRDEAKIKGDVKDIIVGLVVKHSDKMKGR